MQLKEVHCSGVAMNIILKRALLLFCRCGRKSKFLSGAGGADVKQMVYVSFDNNNEFSDFGLKGAASVKLNDTPSSISDGIIKVGSTLPVLKAGIH